MKNFVKLGSTDTIMGLASLSDPMWQLDTYLRDYPQGPFGDTHSVILRFPPRTVHETEELLAQHMESVDIWDCVWYPIAKELPVLQQMVYDLATNMRAERIGRVMVNKLEPGGQVFRHADTPEHANYWSRFHIVLHALPGVDFYCGDEMVNMVSNEIWYFDNRLEHEVINNSKEPRIHMVVDLKVEAIR